MSENLQLSFPGGKRVDVHVDDFHIPTRAQPRQVRRGGKQPLPGLAGAGP